MCASPDTPIATPDGDRPIADLRPGDLVYSSDHSAIRAVPVVAINRVPVQGHKVMRVALSTGRVLEISGPHPLGKGGAIEDLRAGMRVDGLDISWVEWVDYTRPFTYDILPASETGSYFAAGVELRSTLGP
jgi:hypothetical protein